MIGSGRHKIEKATDVAAAMNVCEQLALDGLVIVGGDDSNTNAAVLAEHFEAHRCATKVCGVPKTIDGDLVRNGDCVCCVCCVRCVLCVRCVRCARCVFQGTSVMENVSARLEW